MSSCLGSIHVHILYISSSVYAYSSSLCLHYVHVHVLGFLFSFSVDSITDDMESLFSQFVFMVNEGGRME